MTVKKAIKIIDWWIDHRKNVMAKFQKEREYSGDAYGLEKTLLDVDKTIISNLELIKKELVPKCRHPKKMRDKTSDGQWYCMNCNFDL